MAFTDSTLPAIEAAIVAGLETISGVAKVYANEPGPDLRCPSIVLGVPRIQPFRGEPDEPDFDLGRSTYYIAWDVRLYLHVDGARRFQEQAKQLVGAWLGYVDANGTLGTVSGVEVIDLVLADLEPGIVPGGADEGRRELFAYSGTLAAKAAVS